MRENSQVARRARPRVRETAPALPLEHFSIERSVIAGSPSWTQITDWHRRGFVTFEWKGSSQFCGVVLTEAGRHEVGRQKGETE